MLKELSKMGAEDKLIKQKRLVFKILPSKKKSSASTKKSDLESQSSRVQLLQQQQSTLSFTPIEYKSYPTRWWLLLTVVLLNLANYSHWVAFPSVTKITAVYYDQSGDTMDLIPTVSYGLGVPCCLIATYIVERFGLRTGLQIGGSLTGLGEATNPLTLVACI